MPSAKSCGKSLIEAWAAAKPRLLISTLDHVGRYFVRVVSRKPRNTVSSSKGARMAVMVKRLAKVGTSILMICATPSTVPLPPENRLCSSKEKREACNGCRQNQQTRLCSIRD